MQVIELHICKTNADLFKLGEALDAVPYPEFWEFWQRAKPTIAQQKAMRHAARHFIMRNLENPGVALVCERTICLMEMRVGMTKGVNHYH